MLISLANDVHASNGSGALAECKKQSDRTGEKLFQIDGCVSHPYPSPHPDCSAKAPLEQATQPIISLDIKLLDNHKNEPAKIV